MAVFLPDTDCMIAAICAWHEHHEDAAKEVQQRLDRGDRMIVAAPALVEAYAVLTRLPPPHRLSPNDALALLEANFIAQANIVALDSRGYLRLLRGAPKNGISGGRTYDAVITWCAVKAKAGALLTFNETDFRPLAQGRIEIVVPGQPQKGFGPV